MENVLALADTPTTGNVLTQVLDVFDQIGTWITDGVNSMIPMFYSAEGGLTFLGVLAVAGLAFSVIFLLVGIIQRFLHFGG